jgi:intracellular multiplication protein IcmT
MANTNAHWRDSARVPRFFGLSAYAVFPFLFFLLHMKWWTFTVCALTTIFFTVLEKFGFTLPVFFRWLRCFFGGLRKMAKHWHHPL